MIIVGVQKGDVRKFIDIVLVGAHPMSARDACIIHRSRRHCSSARQSFIYSNLMMFYYWCVAYAKQFAIRTRPKPI